MMFCGECGYKNKLDAKFCEECGKPLKAEEKSEIKTTPKKQKERKPMSKQSKIIIIEQRSLFRLYCTFYIVWERYHARAIKTIKYISH